MTSARTTTAAAGQRAAALFALLVGVVAAGPLCAHAAPALDRNPGTTALIYAQAVQQPGMATPGGAMMGRGRGMTREQFVERVRQRLMTNRGLSSEQATNIANRIFEQADTNRDGVLDPAEFQAYRASHPGMGQGQGRGAAAGAPRPPGQ